MVLGYKYDYLSNITYKINETIVKLLNLKENQGNFDGLTKTCSINFRVKSSTIHNTYYTHNTHMFFLIKLFWCIFSGFADVFRALVKLYGLAKT